MTSLLPPNATTIEKIIEATGSHVDKLDIVIDTLWDPYRCPAEFLPWLAWSFSVDTWDPEWAEQTKRNVIAESFDVHRHKGTRGAIRRALEAIDLDFIKIIEWFEEVPEQVRGTFCIEVGTTSRGLTDKERDQILATILATKNVRSHLRELLIYLQQTSTVPVVAAASFIGEQATVIPAQITEQSIQSPAPYLASALYGAEIATVYPEGQP
ncbi:phage tail protein I [Thalassospira sp.]|jgi:phage tail P2-like protein|uniref:phage tail protein I n=1 Tax=Thalassospira sp. TaxID=1912094 RepID=UPI001B2CDFD2|nr:phage tail protein I [Thalassospira sp.]MBO6805754.1 phage tail protein I [Thalassospira sp.]MBO6841368.1 phage tail protein I [Thalassospira sp.]